MRCCCEWLRPRQYIPLIPPLRALLACVLGTKNGSGERSPGLCACHRRIEEFIRKRSFKFGFRDGAERGSREMWWFEAPFAHGKAGFGLRLECDALSVGSRIGRRETEIKNSNRKQQWVQVSNFSVVHIKAGLINLLLLPESSLAHYGVILDPHNTQNKRARDTRKASSLAT